MCSSVQSGLVSLVFIATLPLLQACSRTSQAAAAPLSPPAVSVVELTPETMPVSSEWIATLDGFVNAQIRPQVSGYLIKRNYREGSMVRKGQVLFEIDPRPFEATLAQAEAQLAQAQAELGRTERDVHATRRLPQQRAIPQSQFDNDIQANLAGAGRGEGRASGRGDRGAQRRLHQRAFAHRRDRGHRHRADWRPGQPVKPPHDGVAGRSDPRVLLPERAGVSSCRRPDQSPVPADGLCGKPEPC